MIRKIVRAVALVALIRCGRRSADHNGYCRRSRHRWHRSTYASGDGDSPGQRILAVSPKAEIPQGARILDAARQALMPGLFDLHTHLNASGTDAVDDLGKSLKAYLVCGVTSVNDYSVYGEMLAPLRALESSGVLVGPRVKFAIHFGTPEGHGAEFGWGDYFTQLVSTPALLPRMAPLDITLCCF
jgi:hypothetical protein